MMQQVELGHITVTEDTHDVVGYGGWWTSQTAQAEAFSRPNVQPDGVHACIGTKL